MARSDRDRETRALASWKPRTEVGQALGEVAWTILDVYFPLRALADRMTGRYGQSAARFGLMRDLAAKGPSTVAQIARARSLARQGVQRLADELTADGLAEYLDNPAHQRSRLLRLTPKGWGMTQTVTEQEALGWDRLAEGLNARELRIASRALKRLKARFRHPNVRVEATAALRRRPKR